MKEEVRKETLGIAIMRRMESALYAWLLHEDRPNSPPLQDFNKMSAELRPADVLLFEGQSRISRAISVISQSQWTHAALYIGRASELNKDPKLAAIVAEHFDGDPDEQLMAESMLGKGMVIVPLSVYRNDRIRLCRPRAILKEDAQQVVEYVLQQVGREYDLRQLIDLARFVFPYSILPRRWLSTLFNYKAGEATKSVCSTVIAEAFMHVQFPVIPVLREVDKNISVHRYNPRLVTPRDFDYSPYFDVIKFPNVNYEQRFLGLSRRGGYRDLPWELKEGVYCNSMEECFVTEDEGGEKPRDEEVRS